MEFDSPWVIGSSLWLICDTPIELRYWPFDFGLYGEWVSSSTLRLSPVCSAPFLLWQTQRPLLSLMDSLTQSGDLASIPVDQDEFSIIWDVKYSVELCDFSLLQFCKHKAPSCVESETMNKGTHWQQSGLSWAKVLNFVPNKCSKILSLHTLDPLNVSCWLGIFVHSLCVVDSLLHPFNLNNAAV